MLRTVYLKSTDTCNLNCSHCFTSGNNPLRYFWNVDEIKDWVSRFMAYIPESDQVHFEFHGGEPMLAPLEQLIEVRDLLRTYKERASIGITTNLVYKIYPEMQDFFNSLDGFATSWDPDIRFANEKQYELWQENMASVVSARAEKGVILNVSVSRVLTQMDQKELIIFLKNTGAYKVLFDRITLDGNAVDHLELFPSNTEINNWYIKMDEASRSLDARKWFLNAALEDVYKKFENGATACGTFCRDCEERLLTISANGAITGCPNSAQEESFGITSMSMEELFFSAKRLNAMTEERMRNEKCFECPVFSYCGSDCHRLSWDGDICPAPKELMKKLAGMSYTNTSNQKKLIIPIFKA